MKGLLQRCTQGIWKSQGMVQCLRASKSGAPLPPLTAEGGGVSPADRQGARRVKTLT